MSVPEEFRVLIEKVRAGQQEAAAELVRLFEPEIRRIIRVRMSDPRLRRVLDSMDICQSVMGTFFARAAIGQFDLERPEQLMKLLVTMARNKIRDKARRQYAGRRDHRLEAGADLADVAGADSTPSRIVSGHELFEAIRAAMNEDERLLADRRAEGRAWADIAAELGGSPEALRKKLARALDRIMQQLGLDEVDRA